jgi:serine protease Do
MIVSGGIALAVPSATVEEFMRDGARPRLGISIQPVPLKRRGELGLLILNVEAGSPAEQASLMIGDVLMGTPEAAFATPADLSDAIGDARAGRLTLRFLRGDRTRHREVVVAVNGRREAAA